ncbi:putative E2-like enzyme [Mycena latifolia]|nr:putative E2-like enzyme [Mycena latifolia]
MHAVQDSKFKEEGRITPDGFVAAGDFLGYKFGIRSWSERSDQFKAKDYLPADKQYLLSRGAHCLRRASLLAYTDADEDAERLLSFGGSTGADEWIETHVGRKSNLNSANLGQIDDIPDLGAAPEDFIAQGVGALSLGDEILDMEKGLEEEDDEATAAPKDKFYQTSRIWLIGYDENRTPLTPPQIFQDISADHALKTVTIEPFLHSASLQAASAHPCKYASVMKAIERMDSNVVPEQGAQGKAPASKDGKKTWFGRKVGGSGKEDKDVEDEDVEGMHVHFYLVLFLKFIVDSTASF